MGYLCNTAPKSYPAAIQFCIPPAKNKKEWETAGTGAEGAYSRQRESAPHRGVRCGTKPPRARSARHQFRCSKKVRTWSYNVARIKLASDSANVARAARSAAQGGGEVSWTFLFCICRFRNSKAEDFWRGGGEVKYRNADAH